MIPNPLASITKEDIDALVANAVSEGRTLDYKESLPGNSDSEKYEFLADVSSFANSSGGDILYGIREKRDAGKLTGIPEAADGVTVTSVDAEILRLDNIIRDGIAPRISNVRMIAIPGFARGPIILVRIPNSWLSPHMISKRESRFYARNNAGKYPLDIAEIRSAFALSESLPDKIRRFRDDRIAKIVADETPVKLMGSSRVVLHVLPVAALNPVTRIDVVSLIGKSLAPLGSSGYNTRLNFDGLLNFDQVSGGPSCRSYVQVFGTGAIETVDGYTIHPRDGKKIIGGKYVVRELISTLGAYLKVEEQLELQPPIFVMVTLLGITGFKMYVEGWGRESEPIDRDTLFLPDIIVENYDVNAATLLRPTFDTLWQACGFEQSPSYDNEGNWKKNT